MYDTADIRKGLKIELDGAPWNVVDFQFVKPGKGTAFTRTRIKNLITGNVIERTFRSGEKLEPADVVQNEMQYMYNDGEDYHFMNTEDFSQITIPAKILGEDTVWLIEQQVMPVMFYKGRPVNVEFPNFVEMEITYCEPGVRGDTANGANKKATLSSGAEVGVPLFVEQGEWIRVDTRTREYVMRVPKPAPSKD